MTAHAEFGASHSKRWLGCPGSTALCKKAPPAPTSAYAQEGTDAHTFVEQWVRAIVLHDPAIPAQPEGDLLECANVMVDAIKERFTEGCDLLLEQKVQLPGVGFGTVDCAIIDRLLGKLTIIDYKHGQGVAVDVIEHGEPNSQLMYYLTGFALKYDFEFDEYEIVVVQPRAFHNDGPVRAHVMKRDEVTPWHKRFKDGVAAAKKKNAPLASGDHCRWCPAAIICPKLTEDALKQAQVDFAPTETVNRLPAPNDLKPEHIGRILRNADRLDAWISSVRSYALDLLQRGGEVEGFKLVPRRGTRKWNDAKEVEAVARKEFGEKAFDYSLKSPAQLEKIAGKEWVGERASVVSSGVTMAPADDKRQAVNQLEVDFKTI